MAYAPNQNEAIQKLMEVALRKLYIDISQIEGFANCDILRRHASSENYFASVCFYNLSQSRQKLPNELSFAIIMPSEIRNYEDTWVGDKWKFSSQSNRRQSNINRKTEDSGTSKYLMEGFLSLQYVISMVYINALSKKSKLPKLLFRPLKTFGNATPINDDKVIISPIVCLQLGLLFSVTTLIKVCMLK